MFKMKRSLKIAIMFLLVAGLLLQLAGQAFSLKASVAAIQPNVKTISPCHQNASSSSHTSRYFPTGNNAENPTILSTIYLFVDVISDRLFFIFLLGFIAVLSLHRIEKPPKTFCYV
jgi:hypothetical protein